jgi:4-diphosphocytidyl-2-C-methyl-D-erythritol kinase
MNFLNQIEAWPAPAKLNLMLRVVGRRADGYHLLQTVFHFIDIADQVSFRLREDGVITRVPDIDAVPEDDDLTVRAARMLQAKAGVSVGVEIELRKIIPMGAGLGGGSSDAATTLLALNRLWELGYSTEQLAEMGLQLGADVPVFIHGVSAWAEGVGEQIEPITLPDVWYLVLFPACHVSTAEIFSDPELTRDSARITIADFFAGSRENDCLPVVSKRYSEVANAIGWLNKYAEARLTGTGAAVFAAFDSEEEAREVLAKLPGHLSGVVGRGLNSSPVQELLRGN